MKRRILFLCTGNSCRSQMAEGWMRRLGGETWEVFSAGIEAHGLNPRAVAAMNEVGIDIGGQSSDILDPELLPSLDLLVTVCGHADETCPVVPANCRKIHWPLPDPAKATGTEEEVAAQFRAVRDELKARVEALLREEG
ncbi:MAG: arsenate reductase (thioredoxin) [Alphaproteobacteria bacterium CG_4_10_14_0_2_um_filter_63_37]|nr:MAG: arsenate reductase (thioredoxin) [Proteobacteria bacterium CG1_02_64_396]PJA25137.1 MAG: arsenate reductase (thioredoxin) [Alphaproteobacteria bacterium CG_4_10_14_0_2_um_filter_63_37]